MASDGEWGQLAEESDELAAAWDEFARLPEPGVNIQLDAFCAERHIDRAALVRIGTKLTDEGNLAFAFPGAIKYRSLDTGARWAPPETKFEKLKVIRSTAPREPSTVLVAEGETDGARLTMLYPAADVAILPAGARRWTDAYTEQLAGYEMVLAALDNDESGEAGVEQISEALPQTMRFSPPDVKDWCALAEEAPALPETLPERPSLIVSAGDLMTLEVPENPSWFEGDLLPIGGSLMLHGFTKSYKSFVGLDMLAAIAQHHPWACFEPIEEPSKVCVIQFEIVWTYYKKRVQQLRAVASDRAAFDQNFLTYSPLARPQLTFGNTKLEDVILRDLVNSGVQVVLVDPIRRASAGLDLNSEQDARKALGFFERINDEGISVVAVHHDNKASVNGARGDVSAMTGSGAFPGDADTIATVSLPKGQNLRSKQRDLFFTLRNAPEPTPREFEMDTEGGTITYDIKHSEEEYETPADHADEPEI